MGEKILAIHQGALGDVILSFYGLAIVKNQRNAVLDLLCRDPIGTVARSVGLADACFDIDGAKFCGLFGGEVSSDLKDFVNGYHRVVVIGLSPNIHDHLKTFFMGKIHWVPSRPPVQEKIHVARHLSLAFQQVGLLTPEKDPLLGGSRGEGTWLVRAERPAKATGGVIVHAGAGSHRKRWHLERFIALASMLSKEGRDTCFMVGPAERDLLIPLNAVASSKGLQVHETDDLSKVVDLMAGTACFVGNDSGLSHLAAYLGVPTVTLFGPSDPARWAPFGTNVALLRGAGACEPCFETELVNCSEPVCFTDVTVDRVLEAVRALLR